MIEVPCLLFELDALMKKVDFVSVGSNDLMQFMFAADRTNARVGSRYDRAVAGAAAALKALVKAAEKHDVPLTLCGEMAGRPIEALALIALGLPLAVDGAGVDRPGQDDDPVARTRAALRKLLDDLLKKRHAQHPRSSSIAFAKVGRHRGLTGCAFCL